MENMSTIFCFRKVLFIPEGEHAPLMLNLSKVKGFSQTYLTGYQENKIRQSFENAAIHR